MTAQWPDNFYYRGKTYELAAATNWKGLFEPSDWGIRIEGMIHTGCMRGYIADYSIDEANRLILKKLTANTGESVQTLNGVAPSASGNISVYKDVGIEFDYTGSFLIGENFFPTVDSYIDERYLEWISYENLWELDFKNGVLQKASELSEAAEKFLTLLSRPTLRVASAEKSADRSFFRRIRLGRLLKSLLKNIKVGELADGSKKLDFSNDEEMFEFIDDSQKYNAPELSFNALSIEGTIELENIDEIRKFLTDNREFRKLLNDEKNVCEKKMMRQAAALTLGDAFVAKWRKLWK